jgi:hypothetical protein
MRGHGAVRGNGSAGRGTTQTGQCYECNEIGHWARNCLRRRTVSNQLNLQNNQPGEQSKGSNGGTGTTGMACGLFLVMHVAKGKQLEGETVKYYLDSGVSGYYIPEIEHLHNLRMHSTPKNIQTASGAYVQVKGVRTPRFQAEDASGWFIGEVPNIEWTPEIKVHLLNPGQLFKDGFRFEQLCT